MDTRTDEIVFMATDVIQAWQVWCESDGWDNDDYDALANALRRLEKSLGAGVTA